MDNPEKKETDKKEQTAPSIRPVFNIPSSIRITVTKLHFIMPDDMPDDDGDEYCEDETNKQEPSPTDYKCIDYSLEINACTMETIDITEEFPRVFLEMAFTTDDAALPNEKKPDSEHLNNLPELKKHSHQDLPKTRLEMPDSSYIYITQTIDEVQTLIDQEIYRQRAIALQTAKEAKQEKTKLWLPPEVDI